MTLRERVARAFTPPTTLPGFVRPFLGGHRRTALETFLRGGERMRLGVPSLQRYRHGTNYAHSWVFACLNRVALPASSVRWAIYEPAAGTNKKQESTRPEARALLGLMDNPNPALYSSGQAFRHDLMLRTLVGGNGFVWKDATLSTGLPARITALGRHQVQPVKTAVGTLASWMVQLGTAPKFAVAPTAMSHVKFPPDPDLQELVLGFGPVQAAQGDLDIDFAQLAWNAALLANSGNVDFALSYKPQRPGDKAWLDDDDLDDIYDNWMEEHGGVDKAGGLHVLNGPFDLVKLGATQKEMDFFNSRKFNREGFAAAIGVPPILVITDGNGLAEAAVKVARRMLYENAVLPLLWLVQAAFQTDFVDVYCPGLIGEFCIEEIPALREDELDKAALAEKYHAMGVPMADLIDAYNLPFPKRPWHDTVFVPYTMAPIEDVVAHGGVPEHVTATPGGTPPVPELPPPGETPPPGGPVLPPAKQAAGMPVVDVRLLVAQRRGVLNGGHVRTVQEPPALTRAERWRAFVRTWEPLEARFMAKIRRHYMPIRAEVLANLHREEQRGAHAAWRTERLTLLARGQHAVDAGQPVVAQRLADQFMRAAKDKARRALFDRAKAARDLRKLTKPLFVQAVDVGMRGAAESIPANAIALESDAAQSLLELKLSQVTRIDDYVEKELFDTLTEGYTAGENLDQLAQRVRDVMNDMAGEARARMIARTELSGAINGGRMIEYESQGVTRTSWLSAQDEHVRGNPDNPRPSDYDHWIDGDEADLGEPFKNGLLYPGDPNGEPGNVIGCRCTTEPVIASMSEAA